MEKGQPPKKNKAYILMCEAGQPGNKAVSVEDFIKDYILDDKDIANYIFEKFNLKQSGVKEIGFTALEQFCNNEFKEFFNYSFNEKNLPMIWCRGKKDDFRSLQPFVLIMSPYYDAVAIHNLMDNTWRVPITMIFDDVTWYVNILELLNVSDVAKANIPTIIMHMGESYTDAAKKLYEYAEVKQ